MANPTEFLRSFFQNPNVVNINGERWNVYSQTKISATDKSIPLILENEDTGDTMAVDIGTKEVQNAIANKTSGKLLERPDSLSRLEKLVENNFGSAVASTSSPAAYDPSFSTRISADALQALKKIMSPSKTKSSSVSDPTAKVVLKSAAAADSQAKAVARFPKLNPDLALIAYELERGNEAMVMHEARLSKSSPIHMIGEMLQLSESGALQDHQKYDIRLSAAQFAKAVADSPSGKVDDEIIKKMAHNIMQTISKPDLNRPDKNVKKARAVRPSEDIERWSKMGFHL